MKILYFASLKENLKMASETIELTNGSSVKQLREILSKKHGKHYFPNNILCAVNQEIANDLVIITKADEVAFYPPVTGG
jgi:molybdopterin synthase sulfur carrier subunit